MTSRSVANHLVILLILGLLASCGSNKAKDGPPRGESASIPPMPDDAIPRPEPKSRGGNGPVYEVFGQRYTVMDSAYGYRERGVASWYGKKFHGNLTSMGDTYDMYGMTAAHKSLPLPTYVRVRNLRNNKTVVVRVNDRGPFVHNRIIDLSYYAAVKLDMIGTGTSLVEVEAITFDEPNCAGSHGNARHPGRSCENPFQADSPARCTFPRTLPENGRFCRERRLGG